MSHMIETMAYSMENGTPWHGLGVAVDEAMTSSDALRLAGLDWDVTSEPIYTAGEVQIPNMRANVRSKDNQVFGVVSDRYKIVQNRDAFAFTDLLIKNDLGIDVRYETAGSLENGRRVWMLAKMPEQKILGDAVIPYLVFVNAHDGKGAVRVAMTPIRVVCHNTLTLGLAAAKRTWSTRHMGNLEAKLEDASNTLQLAQDYMVALTEEADVLQQKKLSDDAVDYFIDSIFRIQDDMSQRQQLSLLVDRGSFTSILNNKADLKPFANTAWGFYNALADFESHAVPKRNTATFRERQFASFIDGNDRMRQLEGLLAIA